MGRDPAPPLRGGGAEEGARPPVPARHQDDPARGSAVVRTGWGSFLARLSMAVLLFEALTGLLITFAPFHPTVQWGLVLHTLVGVLTLLPVAWYYVAHFLDYRHYAMSHIVLLGWVGVIALLVCSASGVVLTWQGLFGLRTSVFWRQTHLISTFGIQLCCLRCRRSSLPSPSKSVMVVVRWKVASSMKEFTLTTA